MLPANGDGISAYLVLRELLTTATSSRSAFGEDIERTVRPLGGFLKTQAYEALRVEYPT